MADTYTSSNRFTKIEPGTRDGTWGAGLNNELVELIDQAMDAFTSVSVSSGGDTTLTTNNGSDDQARSRVLKIRGSVATSASIIIPDQEKWYLVDVGHSGGTVVIKNVADSTGVSVSANSQNMIVYCDGTSTVEYLKNVDYTITAQVSNNLSDLTNVSAARDNLGVQPGSYLVQSSSSVNVNVSAVFDVIYPVGSIYTNYNDSTNPGTLLGFGTWVSVATGRVLVGAGTGVDANGVSASFTATSTGGEYEHTQTSAELASHSHTLYQRSNGQVGTNSTGQVRGATSAGSWIEFETASAGGGQAFNIQQPYLVVHMWRRSA